MDQASQEKCVDGFYTNHVAINGYHGGCNPKCEKVKCQRPACDHPSPTQPDEEKAREILKPFLRKDRKGGPDYYYGRDGLVPAVAKALSDLRLSHSRRMKEARTAIEKVQAHGTQDQVKSACLHAFDKVMKGEGG